MPRLMSVAMTTDAVRARTKTVTRRKGWTFLRPGARLTLCEKVQGRRPGEPLVRLVDVEVLDVRREPLTAITAADVALEGFPALSREEFVGRFFLDAQGLRWTDEITRIQWRYIESCERCREDLTEDEDGDPSGLCTRCTQHNHDRYIP